MLDSRIIETKRVSAHRPRRTPHENPREIPVHVECELPAGTERDVRRDAAAGFGA